MRTYASVLALLIVPLVAVAAPWGSNDIPHSVGWVFNFQNKRFDSELSRDALLSSPSWSPEQPLPVSTSTAVAAARRQVESFVDDPSNWFVREIQILSANPASPSQRWYYAIHLYSKQRPKPGPQFEEIIICVDFSGRPGTIKLKTEGTAPTRLLQ